MRYSLLGGAIQVTARGSRRPLASRALLARAAALAVARSSLWARRAVSRRGIFTVMAGAALIGAAIGGREGRARPAAMGRPVVVAGAPAPGSAISERGFEPTLASPTVVAPPAPAQNPLSSLERPGYLLSTSAATALHDVRVTVADTALLQQLRAEILAPAPRAGLSGMALNDLVSLVRQAQMASAGAGRGTLTPIDPIRLAQAQAAVRDAQQQLVEATKARDQSLPAGPSRNASAGREGTAGPADPALIHDAQSRLTAAQARLHSLLSVATPDVLAAAQKAVTAALAETPTTPSDDRILAARALVDDTQKSYDAAVTRSAHGGDLKQVTETKGNLDSARAGLVALLRQTAYAADPESQPSVIEARKRLTSLTLPADQSAIADAQAVVIATQGQLDTLLGRPAGSVAAGPASTTPVQRPGSVTAAAVAGGGGASATAPGTRPLPAATSVVAAVDSVAQAERRLAEAQKGIRDLVVGSPDSAPPSGNSIAAPNPSLGSTTTQLTTEIQAAQQQLPFGAGVSRNDLSAVEVELRARYVVATALKSARLHPSALSPSAADRLQGTGALGSRALTWPVLGAITQPFGVPELGVGLPHTGVDIGAAIATPVLASASGVVNFAGGDPSASYGYYAIVDHGGGVSTLYAHLALPPFLHSGQFLAQGGLIGLSGSTGFSTGPHVHFEVRLNGVPVDPLKVLAAAAAH